ncbi:cell division protein FtsA [Weissella oryzae SG25]|uniref:Cell division protein FtsA n=1 Tax=Weissella oryzae (strain DSM 25784 / JCM 18191 / LMG 30913 / SG25) TaxID=1329250 RepID=A0A069CTA4_WEIOS|nr:cell division protein FtsA [Weissella oryzae]GAK30637.1 cell division protein FtsA [Weissella oryzae SG25]
MANHGLIVGLDVGTNTVKTLAADVRDQQVNVLAVGRSVSHGVKKGLVIDIESTAKDIQLAMAQVNEQSGRTVTDVIASIPANNIQIQNVSGLVTVKDSQHITYDDVANVVRDAMMVDLSTDRQVVDIVLNEFSVDDFDGIQDPNDMVGMRLAVKATIYTAPRQVLGNLKTAIEHAGLRVRDFVLAPLADMTTILSEAEQGFGTVIIDMGAGQTTATVVQDRQLRFVTVFPAGAEHISKDISVVLNIAQHEAEMLKLDAGNANPNAVGNNSLVINPLGADAPQEITEKYLAEIITARVEQIIGKLGEKLKLVSAFDLAGGVILIGGGAALPGIQDMVRTMYGTKVGVFIPEDLGLRHPGFARSWALIQHAAQQSTVQLAIKQALYNLPVQTLRANAVVKVPDMASTEAKAIQATPVEEVMDFTQEAPQNNANKQTTNASKTSKVSNWFGRFFD